MISGQFVSFTNFHLQSLRSSEKNFWINLNKCFRAGIKTFRSYSAFQFKVRQTIKQVQDVL